MLKVLSNEHYCYNRKQYHTNPHDPDTHNGEVRTPPPPLLMYMYTYNNSAVYTGIKKPESFSHSGFSLKVARQLPLNTPKNPNRKTHLRSVIFWNSAEISLVFCQCKRSLQSRLYYSGFWSRGTWPSAESPDRGPRRNAHYTCTVKGREKSRMRTTYQNTSMRFRFFRACAFCAKNPECYGFFWQCKRYNKKPRFFGFWFLPM